MLCISVEDSRGKNWTKRSSINSHWGTCFSKSMLSWLLLLMRGVCSYFLMLFLNSVLFRSLRWPLHLTWLSFGSQEEILWNFTRLSSKNLNKQRDTLILNLVCCCSLKYKLGLCCLYLQFYKNLSNGLKDIIWKAEPLDEETDG